MIDESFMDIIINLVSSLGVPAALIILLLSIAFKFIPDFLTLILDSQKETQKYNLERKKLNDDQVGSVSKLLGETNEVIKSNTVVVSQNSQVLEQMFKLNEDVLKAIGGIDSRIASYEIQLASTDKMLVRMNSDVKTIVAVINATSKGSDKNENTQCLSNSK